MNKEKQVMRQTLSGHFRSDGHLTKLITGTIKDFTNIHGAITENNKAGLVRRIVGQIKGVILSNNNIVKVVMSKDKDGIWCPRCGEVFHDKDMADNPNDYYTCPLCYAIQHTKCRGATSEEPKVFIEEA